MVDATDLVILDPAALPAQGVAVPADALDRDRVIDMIGDVEELYPSCAVHSNSSGESRHATQIRGCGFW